LPVVEAWSVALDRDVDGSDDRPQGGIFALGTASHAYLEFDAVSGRAADIVAPLAGLGEPRTTMGGVNLVVGFRPTLWAEVVPDEAPAGVSDFDDDLVG